MSKRKFQAALAAAAIATAVASGTATHALAAAPSPSPSPSPSPPPQALSCTSTQYPALFYGILPAAASSNVQVSTTVQVIPATADGLAYLAYQEKQVRAQQAQMNGKPHVMSTPASYLEIQNQSESFSALARRLAPFIETTSTDSLGNWACGDLTPLAPYLLFAALTINTTTSATAPPAVKGVSGNPTVMKTQTTQIYYASRATIQILNRNSQGLFRLNVPFAKWTKIAEIDQPA